MQDSIIIDILKVAKSIRKCKLDFSKLNKVESELERLQSYFDCNLIQVIYLIITYENNSKDLYPTKEDFSAYLNCNPIELIPHKKEFQELLEKADIIIQNQDLELMHDMCLENSSSNKMELEEAGY